MSITVQWFGPFASGEAYFSPPTTLTFGQSAVVPATVAIGCMAADASWWGAIVDGGSAASAFIDNLDGGTSKTQAFAAFSAGHA